MTNPIAQQKSDTYCIREDYVARAESTTFEDEDAGSYWNADRLATTLSFQYDVYRIAYEMAAKRSGRVRMLDVGCGPARKHNLFHSGPSLEVTLVDQPTVRDIAVRYVPDAEFHPVNLETAELDLGQEFDIVICADVVEHLVDPDPCLRFIKKHTSKDGVALISTPERERLYGMAQLTSGHPCHIREWSFSEFSAFILSRGLGIDQHVILHQQRSHWLSQLVWPLGDRLGFRNSTFSCQLAVCTVPSP